MRRLTLGCTMTDRTRPLVTGQITVPGYEFDVTIAEPREIFSAALRDHRFDICEMSMGSHIEETAAGDGTYVGIPVFLSRAFRHDSIFVRRDRGIERPRDLQGRVIGVVDYSQTAGIWVRGMLRDYYGVDLSGIEWLVGPLEEPAQGLAGAAVQDAARRIASVAGGESLNTLLVSGEIDAIISPRPPRSLITHAETVGRLFEPAMEAEKAYFRETGFFPIMHCLAVRRTLAEREPDLPRLLMVAFSHAKRMAERDLTLTNYARVAIPWLSEHVAEVRNVLGPDPWRYGFKASQAELSAMTRYAWEDGITARQVDPSDLFHAATLQAEGIEAASAA